MRSCRLSIQSWSIYSELRPAALLLPFLSSIYQPHAYRTDAEVIARLGPGPMRGWCPRKSHYAVINLAYMQKDLIVSHKRPPTWSAYSD